MAEGLDNTAPVEQLIDNLQSNIRKNKLYVLYCQAVRQRRTTIGRYLDSAHYLLPGHPLNVFNPDWEGGLNSGYFETFSHKSLMPKIISKVRNVRSKDPVTEYMRKKIAWQDTLMDYKRIMSLTSKKRKYEWINDEILHCPKHLVQVAAHYEQNPDPYFDSNYNWYYAGNGNMQHIALNGLLYMLHSEFSCVYLSPFFKHNLSIDYESMTKYDCGKDLNIFETICSQNIITVRTRNKIIVLKILDNEGIVKLEKIKEMESKIPFTGITFDDYHKNILYVTTLDFKLTIVNIDRMKGRSKQLRAEVSSMINNWSTVIGTDRSYFSHITKNSITLYDKRTNYAYQRWKNIRQITDDISCNDISVAKHGTDNRLMYIGSDHHLFLLDLRFNKVERNKLKAVQRWTHGMQSLPTYMAVSKFEYNKELICLSSQWCEDMCIISNYADRLTRHNDISGVTIPYRPPTVLQALKEAKEKMYCCDLFNSINTRLCSAITGLTVLEQDDSFDILMLNSLGDISCHTLCPHHMTAFFEDTSLDLLNEWSKSFVNEPKVLEVSSILDISNVLKELKRVPDDYKLGENRYLRKSEKFNEKEIYDAFENEELEEGLLEVWSKGDAERTEDDSLNFFSND